ncbi:ABC transporter substrate-binding protein [Streptomyces caniscabiei]|uniref:Carbohydrate ABC transporter substrate-binding protein n=1 Tax=Streptomyces caniscabiei TaxID=2746961 RepID=A0A927QF35_9ACTN|nr:ABC transporter substrate-binding protein [Streptomyces caniscabiei]MBD9703778.1 carbohydrate ABC transporter substrate-binding protein [Streptomyces caniscabiei]MBD9723165.1 carbohydrate ABC transporter substrate-binding protein [Streptomyces caniscabiei]MDX3511845.1 ABC transporter substrate-binding protein [Streptomyces caniscabiei]MDX3719101.1 ABC transporter substrate-binding protein [Streptomyces caniscabiei]MDX3725908.1 ABC transporter substrate-binding protein [Streptomyces caniscab
MRARTRTARKTVVLAAVAALGAGLLAGCAEDSDGGSSNEGDGNTEGKTTLTVGTFGVFGYKQAGLYDEYMKQNPDIVIKENVTTKTSVYWPKTLTRLQAGSGTDDIQAIEIGNVTEAVQTQGDKFVDLGKEVDKSQWLDWKNQQATTKDGKLIGLGTDIGPMAICYRKDLFEKAGLETDRTKLAEQWKGDWGKYVDLGKEYMKKAPKGTKYVDSASSVYNAALGGATERYYDKDGNAIWEKSTGVKDSWDAAMSVATSDMSAKLKQFEAPWDQGYAKGSFATVACPAWMIGYIQEKSGEAGKGKWDVAAAPTAANWGGAFIGVPTASKHQKEAIALAKWLTAPEQQAKVFAKQASFPSTPSAYPTLKPSPDTTSYFSDAPLTQIFSDSAKTIPVQHFGTKDQPIGTAIADIGIVQVEQKGKSPEEGWEAASKEIKDVLGQ